jgi:hypothetical protein
MFFRILAAMKRSLLEPVPVWATEMFAWNDFTVLSVRRRVEESGILGARERGRRHLREANQQFADSWFIRSWCDHRSIDDDDVGTRIFISYGMIILMAGPAPSCARSDSFRDKGKGGGTVRD